MFLDALNIQQFSVNEQFGTSIEDLITQAVNFV